MEKNTDSRRATLYGLPRRKQRVASLRDSAGEDKEMELRDREQFRKKEKDRDFPKRRRVENSRSTHSSDEEYFEEEDDEARTSQLLPASSSLRRGLHTQRSSPVLRDVSDEVLGVPIPRRARSASGKKLHEHPNSGSGDRKSTPSPDTGSPIGPGGASPPYSGASMKKKMKCVEPRTPVLSCASNPKSSSLIQNDIEIEVAEALFDLMTQSRSQSQPSERKARVYRDGINTSDEEFRGLKAERGKVENDAFKVQNEESVKADSETILFESMNNNKGGEKDKEKVRDEPAQESVRGDGFVDRGKVGSLKESESSCVKRNACDIQDPTVTKSDYATSVVESINKKEARIVIDLMELPSLPSSPERETLPHIDPQVTTRDVTKKSEVAPKIGVISDYDQLSILNLEKKRRHNGISSVGDNTSQQPQGRKVPNIQSPPSLLSFPIGLGSWPCVLPHPGYMPSLGGRSSMTMQPPKFKFVKPRTKRCTTHRLVADNIRHHQQLVTKSLSSSSGPMTAGGVATLYGTKPLSLKSIVPTQRLTPGKDKSSDVAATAAAAADFNPATDGKPMLLQQQNSGFTLALGHHQTTMMMPDNSSGGPPQSNSSRKVPPNSSFPEAQLTSVTFNQHNPYFPSNETAASYMAMLQSGGRPIPIPTNISLPSFKSGPSLLNSSFYSPPVFNIAQIQQPPSQMSQPPSGDNKFFPQHDKNSNNNVHAYSYHGSNKHGDIPQQGGSKNRVELAPQHYPLSFSSNLSSMTQSSTIFQMLPELSRNGSNKASKGKSQTDSTSDNPFLASFYHHQHQMQQLLLKGGASAAAIQPDYLPSLPKLDNFPRATTTQEGSSHQSRMNGTRLKGFQGQNRNITLGSSPSSAQGNQPGVINSQPVVVYSLIAGQRNNASAVPGLASQETEGSSQNGGSTPACRKVVPSILRTCASQLSEIKYG